MLVCRIKRTQRSKKDGGGKTGGGYEREIEAEEKNKWETRKKNWRKNEETYGVQ